MRRTCPPLLTASLLALGLLAAPLAAAPLATAAAPAGSPTTVAGDAPLSRPATPVASEPVAARAAATAARPTTVAPAPRTGAYAFLQLDGGQPVRWNPCADVPWLFNPAGAPAGGLAAVRAAVREIGVRTGLRFVYQGTTAKPVTGKHLKQTWRAFQPLLVGWTTAGQSDLLAGRGPGTVGVARVLWTGSYDSTGANRTQMASGVVALNRATRAPATGAGSWYTYALHELGHAVGLDHVADSTQVMNPVISGSVKGFGRGDSAGLVKVGAGAGCLPEIR